MAHETICKRCSALLTVDGLKQAQTAEGFPLRPVSDYGIDAKYQPDKDWDGVDGNRCWMCIQVQHWVWPRLTDGPLTPWGEYDDNGGGMLGPWTEPGAWVGVWSNLVELPPSDHNRLGSEGGMPVSLPGSGLKPFNFLSVKDPRIHDRIFPVRPTRGFVCWVNGEDDREECIPRQRFPEVEFNWIPPLIRRMKIKANSCLSTHSECGQQSIPLLPKRVIDVGPSVSTSRTASLHVSEPNQRANYACLSYCWGKEQQYTLKNANEATLRSEIDFPRLGQTIQDAITMTQLLGLRYLWVDALCILQDDANDKAIEIKKMASIYGSATLTFYIGQAESVKEGFLAPHLTKPREKGHQGMQPTQHQVPLPTPHKSATINLLPIDNRAVDKFSYSGPFERDVVVPLDYRAWAFQEFLLSPRILLFMSLNVYWVCRRWHYQPMYSQNPFHRNAGNINSIPHLNEIISQGKRMPRSDFFKAWNYIFSDYSYRKLTDPEDRLDALTGVLSVISEAREDKCHFGHWESTLPGSLMWQSSEGTPGRHSRAPSWSWAAGWRKQFPIGESVIPQSEVLDVKSNGILKLRARALESFTGSTCVDDETLCDAHHSWLRVVVGNYKPYHTDEGKQGVLFTCLMLEKTSAVEDGMEVFCRRGVAHQRFDLSGTTVERLLEEHGVERDFLIK